MTCKARTTPVQSIHKHRVHTYYGELEHQRPTRSIHMCTSTENTETYPAATPRTNKKSEHPKGMQLFPAAKDYSCRSVGFIFFSLLNISAMYVGFQIKPVHNRYQFDFDT